MEERRRKLIWGERKNFHGWACSECAWQLNSASPPVGQSLEEMQLNYEKRRDKEFASHVCTANPATRTTK